MTAVTKSEPITVAQLLKSDKAKAFLAPFLQKGISVERVLAQAQLAVSKTPALADCTPRSVLEAVARIEAMDLEVGVTAHLVPFGDVCTAIADYKGLIELMYRSGVVRMLDVMPVYEKDVFRYSLGLSPELHHEPAPAPTRGKLIGAWAVATLAFNAKIVRFMATEDIDAIRQKHSKQWKQGPLQPWYACKTLVRQIAKLLPKNAKIMKALEVIEQEEADEFGAVRGEPGDGPRSQEIGKPEAPRQLHEAHAEPPTPASEEEQERCPECGHLPPLHFQGCAYEE